MIFTHKNAKKRNSASFFFITFEKRPKKLDKIILSCYINRDLILQMRVWRNWQTRKIQVLITARLCRFNPCYPHHDSGQ